jgi:hypothetical protein
VADDDIFRLHPSLGPVELPWESRKALLDRLSGIAGTEGIREEFTAAGSTRPVELGRPEVELLVGILHSWALFGGVRRLPPGIWDLHNALNDDLRAAHGRRPSSGAGPEPPRDVSG